MQGQRSCRTRRDRPDGRSASYRSEPFHQREGGGGRRPVFATQEGQLGIAGTAPGSPGYRGGSWAVNVVAWNVAPYLLTSEAAVLAAEADGDVTVTRTPGADFRCPVQP
jgi:hypothetical protein